MRLYYAYVLVLHRYHTPYIMVVSLYCNDVITLATLIYYVITLS